MADDPSQSDSGPRPGQKHRGLRMVVAGILLGSLVGLVGVFLMVEFVTRGQPRVMTRGDFEAAVSRWESDGPAGYDLDLVLSGGQTGRVHVEVRNHEVILMTENDITTPPPTWRSWSVPGLLDIIRIDLDRNVAAAKTADRRSPEVFQQAQFDPRWGFPIRYRRTEMTTGQWAEWRIVQFQPTP